MTLRTSTSPQRRPPTPATLAAVASGLSEIVVARKRQQEIGGHVILRSPTEQTLRILEIVGLTQIFTIA